MAPDLTVVVPTYNGAEFLETTLDSLAMQTDVALEVIVVDDGSSDGSADLADGHSAVTRLVRQSNRGVAAARNRGLVLAAAEHVAFVDQDDLWHPRRARILLDLLASTGAAAAGTTEFSFARSTDRDALERVGDGRHEWPQRWLDEGQEIESLCGSDVEQFGGDGQITWLSVDRFMVAPAAVTTSFVYRREPAIMAGGCAAWVRAADDHVLNTCLAGLFGDIPRIDVPCLFYRVHPASTSTVSPLVAPFLSMSLALRFGRALPSSPVLSDYMEHLQRQLPDTDLPVLDQLAFLILTTPRERRLPGVVRFTRRGARKAMQRLAGRGSR